jgi:hypothetical protein
MKRISAAAMGVGIAALSIALSSSRSGDAQPKSLETRIATLEQHVNELKQQNAAQQTQLNALKEADKAEKAQINQVNTHHTTQINALIDQNKVQQGMLQNLVATGNQRDVRLKAVEAKVGIAK